MLNDDHNKNKVVVPQGYGKYNDDKILAKKKGWRAASNYSIFS